jgi:hypothetical protein
MESSEIAIANAGFTLALLVGAKKAFRLVEERTAAGLQVR